MNLTTAAKRLAIKSPVVVKKILDDAGIQTQKAGRDLYIDDLAFNEAFKLDGGSDEMLSLSQAAAMLKISVASARNRLCVEGGVAEKIGGSWRIRMSDIQKMLPQQEMPAEAAGPEGQSLEESQQVADEGAQGVVATTPSTPAMSFALPGTEMAFSRGMYERISSDADAALAMLNSLSTHMSAAVEAWRADCSAILGSAE